MEFITPQLITWVLTGLGVLFLFFGFLHGYIRGAHKATYRFVVSLVVILGLWTLLPTITAGLFDYNFGSITTIKFDGFEGYEFSSVNEIITFFSKYLLGFIKEENGVLVEVASDIVIQDTMLYGLIYGLGEMIVRIVLLLVIIILNWTIFRVIFWIFYRFIKPKKQNRFNAKTKTKKSRLIGGLIGAVNTIFIYLIICVPLSGVFSIADNAANLIDESQKVEEEIINVSLGTEVITLSGENLANFNIKQLKAWTSIYRNSLGGFLFSLNVGNDTALDCAIFDKVFAFKAADENIAIRKEIDVVADAATVIKEDIIQPMVNGEDTDFVKVLDNLSSEDIRAMFTELGNLKVVNIVVPIGLESAIIIVKNDDEMAKEYAKLVDIIEKVDPKDIVISDTIVQIGEVSASLKELVEKSGYKLSELLAPAEGGAAANYLDVLLKVDTEAVTNVFDAIGNITIIDTIQEISFAALEDYMDEAEGLEKFILMYPHITVSDDGYYVISGTKSNVQVIEGKDLNNLLISLDDNDNWVIEGIATTINGSENLFKIQLNDVKITDEIKNIGNLYSAFKKLGITSFSEITAFIDGGPDAVGSLDISKFTYENLDGLFASLLNFKIISNHLDNIYVILNNFLPNEYHEMLTVSEIDSEDLTSLVYAAKIVAETGVLWNMDEKINTNGEIDYTKVYEIFNDVKEELAKGITDSSIIVDNINTVADYAIKTFAPELTLDFSCVNWQQNGEEELNKFFNVVSVVLKHGNKLMKDFYSLTDEELDELCDVLADNFSQSVLLQNNMNNIIDLVSSMDAFKEMGITLDKLEEGHWTEEELRNIFGAVKVVVKVMSHAEGDEGEKNLLVELLKLTEEDLDTFLNSEFIVKNLAHNLVEMSKEGGLLYEKIIVNLEADSPEWFDVYEGDTRVKEGELRIILSNAIKLIDGIKDFENTDLLIETIVKNIPSLSNNFGEEDDEIGDLLSSKILSDTIIYYLENLDTKLSEDLAEIIVISDGIVWKDTTTEKGELRKILAVFSDILIDKDGNVIVSDLQEGDSNKIIELVLDLDDTKLDTILDSKIILDTIVKFIEEFGEGEESSFTIYLKDKDRDDVYWRNELKSVLKGLKVIAIDEEGKFIEFGNDTKQYVDILTNVKEDDVETLVASEILVDTIAHLLIDLAEGEDSFFVVSDKFRAEVWTDTQTTLWREEIKKIITTAKVLLVDEEGNSVYDDLTGNDTNKQIQILVNISEEKYDDLVASEIITDTIAKIIKDLGEDGTITISEIVKDYITTEWQDEIKAIISSVKKILVDEEGNVDIDNILSDIDTLITNVVNLNNNPNGENDEIGEILTSQIICDTIIEQIKLQSKENGGMLVVSEDIVWTDTVVNGVVTETGELRNIFKAIKTIFKDETIDLENLNVDDLVNDVVNLSNNPNDIDDEVGDVLSSRVISDTIIELLKEQSKDNGGMLIIANDITWNDTIVNGNVTETGELRNIFSAINVMYKDSEINFESINVDEILEKAKSLNSNPNGENDEVGKLTSSRVIGDTAIAEIIKLGEEGTLTVNYDANDARWYDTYTNNTTTSEGELRKIFSVIPVIFTESVDMNSINANIILDLSDSDVDTVLGSVVFADTIETKLYELDGQSDIVVNEITDLNKEVKAIIKASKILLADEEGNVDLDNPNFDVEKAINLTDSEQDTVLSSQIIVDTISEKLIDMSEDESSMLVVNTNNISNWKVEIKNILGSIKMILTPDGDGKYLSNPQVDYDKIYSLEENDITKLLLSDIITDTLAIALVDTETLATDNIIAEITLGVPGYSTMSKHDKNVVITSSNIWRDSNTENGEVHKLLTAAQVLIDNQEVDINKLKTITDPEIDTVFESRIILDTFYNEIDELSEGADAVLFVKEGTVKDKAEAKKFVKSIKVVLGDSDITNMDSSEFNFDKFTSLSNEEIATLIDSTIIKYSAAKKVYPVLDSGELSSYVVVNGANEDQKIDTISDDLDNLLMMVRDMDQKHGISYQDFSFNAFLEVIENAGDEDAKNAKADAIADTLLISNIMKDSVDTMMHTVLEGSLDDEMLSAIDLDMNKESSGGRNEWLDYDVNSNGTIEETEIGEFKKIFRLLANIDQFTNESAENNSNITDKDEIAKPLKAVNNSKVLCGIIPMFVDKATANVETWKYNEGDALYKETLTKEEWDEEIEVISTIIALVNNESSISNLASIDVNDESFALDSLKELLKEIAKSRILDISNIEGFVQDGVNSSFFDGENKVTVTNVYTGNKHNEKVDAWNHESTGEIDALINAIEKLRSVKSTSINDKSAAPTNTYGYIYQGEMNAHNMGQFLNAAKESTMLSSVITTIVYEMIGQSISEGDVQSTNFTSIFVAAAKLATGRFPF